MPPIELDPIPDPAYPDGSVVGNFDGSGNPYEKQELLHRPHAFALMHGDGGAKVAYGQLLWRYDVLHFDLNDSTMTDVNGVGQGYINGFHVEAPTIGAADGEPMNAGLTTKYHELDEYGDVYLYWTTDLDASSIENAVNACWVQVGGDPAQDILDDVPIAAAEHDRVAGVAATEGQKNGTYRVKLGTVNEDDEVTQNHSSDVFWSFVLFQRYA